MGFKISWLGFRDVGKDIVLSLLDLVDTGQIDEANESPFSGADMPGGWFIVFVNDFLFVNDFESATPSRLSDLSRDCKLVACQVHEGIMVSVAYYYDRGQLVWQMMHDAQEDMYDLSVSGSPPPEFEPIRTRLMGEQDAAGGRSSDVDYIFDIPLGTAFALCGYRHDKWRYDWGTPAFTRLERVV